MGNFSSKICGWFLGFNGEGGRFNCFEVCRGRKNGDNGNSSDKNSNSNAGRSDHGIESEALLGTVEDADRDDEEGTVTTARRYGSFLRSESRAEKSFRDAFIAVADSYSSESSTNNRRTLRIPDFSINRWQSKLETNKDKRFRRNKKIRFAVNWEDDEIDDENKSEEQKLFLSIVEETALNMINVNGSSDYISRREARERSRYYAKTLEKLSPSLLKRPSELRGRLLSVFSTSSGTRVTGVTQAISIAQEDAFLMNWATEEVSEALKCIRVPTQELDELVVPFPS